jgi:hypothetical protein
VFYAAIEKEACIDRLSISKPPSTVSSCARPAPTSAIFSTTAAVAEIAPASPKRYIQSLLGHLPVAAPQSTVSELKARGVVFRSLSK